MSAFGDERKLPAWRYVAAAVLVAVLVGYAALMVWAVFFRT